MSPTTCLWANLAFDVVGPCQLQRRKKKNEKNQMLKTMKSVFVLQPPSEFLVLFISWNCGKLPIEDDF